MKPRTIHVAVPPDYADRIKALRTRHDLTQGQLADLLGVSYPTVSRWESGQARPAADAWRRIARAAKPSSMVRVMSLRVAPDERSVAVLLLLATVQGGEPGEAGHDGASGEAGGEPGGEPGYSGVPRQGGEEGEDGGIGLGAGALGVDGAGASMRRIAAVFTSPRTAL